MPLAAAFYEDPLTLFVIGLILLILFFWYFATDVERRKRNVGSVLLIGVCALCIVAVTPPKERLKGGIDIVGGSSFTLRIQEREGDDGAKQAVTSHQVDQAIMVIEKRLNGMGTTEPFIARQGSDRIIVQMPGIEPEQSAKVEETLEKVAKLELREVSPRNAEVGDGGKSLAQRVMDGEQIVPGYKAFNYKHKNIEGTEINEPILLKSRAALGGSDIANAYPSPQQADAVAIALNGPGSDKMIALTKDMRPGVDRIAIVLDGEVISAPAVNQVPLGKNFIVEGLHEPGEVQSLANSLMNPLENPLVVEQSSTVSPSYGDAIIKQGIWAGLFGLAITFTFLVFYYRTAGLVALIGLTVNGVILFGIMAMFGFTFSLPGIAGMILTIGMAVDANVLIYERLREEQAAGKSLKSAITASYEKAFTAIFDANLTSLITSVILFWLGSGTIKGFAITLTIGILASLFSSILVTRVLFRWGIDSGILKKLSFMNLVPPTNFDFLGKAKISAVISLALLLVCAAAVVIRKDKALGIDFTGGTIIRFQLGANEIPIDDVNKVVENLELSKAAYAQEESNMLTGTLLSVRCATIDADKVTQELRQQLPALAEKKPVAEGSEASDADASYVISASKEDISGLISGTYLKQSLLALAFGLVGILLYIALRFEWSFAIGGFISTLYDVAISVGLFIMLTGELSLIHVGAVLTIAGYSINDTIVVFDRIRENLLMQKSGSLKSIMNEAINATLSRTLLTGPTTILTVAILSIFGGSALRDFSLIILIGLVVGTFSSVFIASPIVLWWSNRRGGNLRNEVLSAELSAEAKAAAP